MLCLLKWRIPVKCRFVYSVSESFGVRLKTEKFSTSLKKWRFCTGVFLCVQLSPVLMSRVAPVPQILEIIVEVRNAISV